MKEFQFFQGDFPKDFSLNLSESLFNTLEHRTLQARKNWISFFVLNKSEKKVEACLHVHISENIATSPYQAPFGSFDFSESITLVILSDFIKFIENSLQAMGIVKIAIKMPPIAYAVNSTSIARTVLMKNKFQIELSEVSSLIQVDERDFRNRIKNSEQQVLEMFYHKGFECRRVPIENLQEVYVFIQEHYAMKGYLMSMTFEELQRTVDAFKNNFFLFTAWNKEEMIAASVSIQVMDHVLYNFYISHKAAYNRYSPVVALIGSLYNFCKENNLSILDLGTSMLNNAINQSLLDFKHRLGGADSEKYVLSKTLN